MKTLCLCLHTKGSLTDVMENGKNVMENGESAGSPSCHTLASSSTKSPWEAPALASCLGQALLCREGLQ